MGVDWIYYAYVAIVLLTVARILLADNKQPKPANSDDQPTTLSRRGTFLNYWIGRRRIGPGFGWADDEGVISHTSGGGGGKSFGGGGGGGGQTTYYMDGWHQMGPGPATSLFGIWENGKQIYSDRLDRATTPSGTLVTTDAGSFKIYWGEFDQPVCEELAAKIGVRSRWPGLVYIYWIKKTLGGSPLWGQLEYEFENAFACVGTLDQPYMLDDGNSRGVNPAHAIAQLITGRFPYGMGYPSSSLDKTTLSALAELMIDEHLPVNMLIQDGDTAEKHLGNLLVEMGVMMPDHLSKLIFVPVREPAVGVLPPELSDDVLMGPMPEIDTIFDEDTSNRVVWTYKDEAYNFRDNDIPSDDDGVQSEFGAYRTTSVALETVTNKDIAAKLRGRRDAEAFGNTGGVQLKVLHGGSLLIPGFPFVLPDVGPMRVSSVKRSVETAEVQVEAAIDAYSVNVPVIINNDNPAPIPTVTNPAPDLAFDFFELPPDLTGGLVKIAVLRIRAHAGISGAVIWGSADGATYSNIGSQNGHASGGPITGAIGAVTDDVVENGPLFEALNDDILGVRDLSGAISTWQAGSQMAVINGECFYLRNITVQAETARTGFATYALGEVVIPDVGVTGLRYICVQAGTTAPGPRAASEWPVRRGEQFVDGSVIWEAHGFEYQMHGIIRARLGTVAEAHGIDDVVYIFQRSEILPISAAIISPGVNLCIKTQPTTYSQAVSLSGIGSVCHVILGIGTGQTFLSLEGSFCVTQSGDTIILKD